MSKTTVYRSGRFLTTDGHFAHSIIVSSGKIVSVNDGDNAQPYAEADAKVVDLGGRVVLPAFVDAHCHLLQLGESLGKVDLVGCKSLAEIQARIAAYDKANPNAPRILVRNWIPDMTKPEEIDRISLDGFSKPVYIESFDIHSCLLNTAALQELSIDENIPAPSGGEIVRDAKGRLTGLMKEQAYLLLVGDHLQSRLSITQKREYIATAFTTLLQSGYTGVADLLMQADVFAILEAMVEENGGRLPMRVRAYWLVNPEEALEDALHHIEVAKSHQEKWKGHEWLQINGIKLVSDGVIDSCTATMLSPYRDGSNGEPIWPLDRLTAAVQKADGLDLQCAIHAIGDLSVHNAIEALATVGKERIAHNRHRIEHLEMSAVQDGVRLGQLGITASVQPVHSDPAILSNWYDQLGGKENARCCRAFAYKHFLEAGAPIAIGTDAPTAPHPPLPNLHIATTRMSAQDPTLTEQTTPQYALPLVAAIAAATKGAARACHLDHLQGSFEVGSSADFNVLDIDIFASSTSDKQHILLKAKVSQTYFQGKLVGD